MLGVWYDAIVYRTMSMSIPYMVCMYMYRRVCMIRVIVYVLSMPSLYRYMY